MQVENTSNSKGRMLQPQMGHRFLACRPTSRSRDPDCLPAEAMEPDQQFGDPSFRLLFATYHKLLHPEIPWLARMKIRIVRPEVERRNSVHFGTRFEELGNIERSRETIGSTVAQGCDCGLCSRKTKEYILPR